MKKQLVIINNESTFNNGDFFFCDNIAMKTISEGLNKNFEVAMILRKSSFIRSYKINLKKIKTCSNIFSFILSIFKTFKYKETSYLIISITPYTFFAYIFLFLFNKKKFVYLRSNGYEEYKAIFGIFGPFIYHIMYKLVTYKSKIIVCQQRLANKKKCHLVYPSELDDQWFKNTLQPELNKPRLLYVGRIKVEKGIFSLIKIFSSTKEDVELSIVGNKGNVKLPTDKINYIKFVNDATVLRKIYDEHNIFILPSFTEAHPQVIDESLARLRPVIIFEDIQHVIQNRSGIFVSKRNMESLSETIKFIMKNYNSIQENIKKNKLPTKKAFINQMVEALEHN